MAWLDRLTRFFRQIGLRMNLSQSSQTDIYSAFAEIYDDVMRDVDYETWSHFIVNLCIHYGFEVNRILDVACGTGSLTRRLAEMGYEVTGIDQSPSMLKRARQYAKEEGLSIHFAEAMMEDFRPARLSKPFDLIVCLYDSVNYLMDAELVAQCFGEAHRHLRPNGAFIFDVTTEYNLLHNFSGYTFAENLDDVSYIWENDYDIINKVCKSKVTIFKPAKGRYDRFVEMHLQRVYPTGTLRRMLEEAGFAILGTYHNMTMKPVQPKSERIHFVCVKLDEALES